MVSNAETGSILDIDQFQVDNWAKLIASGSERRVKQEFDDQGCPLPLPELHDDWLTPAE